MRWAMEAPSRVDTDLEFNDAKRFGLRKFGAVRELLRLELSHSEAHYRIAQLEGNRAAAARCMQAVLFNRALVECEARLTSSRTALMWWLLKTRARRRGRASSRITLTVSSRSRASLLHPNIFVLYRRRVRPA